MKTALMQPVSGDQKFADTCILCLRQREYLRRFQSGSYVILRRNRDVHGVEVPELRSQAHGDLPHFVKCHLLAKGLLNGYLHLHVCLLGTNTRLWSMNQ